MYCYIKTPRSSGGFAPLKGTFECVYARDHATELEEGDARHFLREANVEWHDRKWQIEKCSNGKYIIKGESIHRSGPA